MFFSKNNTFLKPQNELSEIRLKMVQLLKLKNRGEVDSICYQMAFDFFSINPRLYDGATVVKDLDDLPNLDLDAMLHDYQYIKGANTSFRLKWKADWMYIKNMERNGKGIRIFRLLLLTLIGIVFVPYCKIQNKQY